MRVAIISDIHDNLYNLISFYEDIENKNIDKILCLWDLMNAWIANVMAFSWIPVHMIFWNNDWWRSYITKVEYKKDSKLTVKWRTFDMLKIDWKRVFMTHYDMLASSMAKSWDFDVVFYGHDHLHNIYTEGNTLVVNPGEIASARTWTATYAIYDTKLNKAEIIELKDILCTKHNKISEYRKKIWFDYEKWKRIK